jgi:glycosyltransferase involved in cell wall biosynthesis
VSAFSLKVSHDERRGNASVIGAGVDLDTFTPGPDGDAPRRRVLFVGRLLPHKGVDYLIRALPPHLGLDVVGAPLDKRYVDDLIELASGKDVTFRHDASQEEVVSAYQRALCVVLPSVYRDLYGDHTAVPELLGQTLIEAMACGTAVVCTSVGGMPEVVIDGETGYVVAPNDPSALNERIKNLATEPDTTARMGLSGRARTEAVFSWHAVAARCLTAYAGGTPVLPAAEVQ